VRPRLAATALAIAALVFARRAAADDTDRQIAQQLFDEGRVLLDAGKVAEACPKFAESQRLDPGGGTLLNLALCHEREGKTATAWGEYRDALGQAVQDDRKDREAFAREHIDALAPKLVRVVVVVPPGVAANKPEIMLDRSKLPDAAWGSAIPVDPGEHRISATATYYRPWATTLTASEPGKTYTVEVPAGEAPDACPSGHVRVKDACVAVTSEPPRSKRSTAFWVVLGSSGALAAASLVTGIVAYDADRYVKDNCSAARDFCKVSDAGDAATRAKTFAWISTVTLGAAAAGAVVAFLLPKIDLPRVGVHGEKARLELGPGVLRITGM
jgi:hypothetical protein